MFGLGKIQALAVCVLFFAVWTGSVYWRAHSDGVASERAATLQATIDQIKERAETDAEIRDMDTDDLCRLLGGRMSDNGCE